MIREEALSLVREYVKNEGLVRHMLSVEAAMRFYAEKFGENVEYWGLVGLLHARRSIRKFTAEAIGDADVVEILDAAMAAPSAGNQQPWHFVVIRDRSLLNAVPGFHPHARMAEQAPVAVLASVAEALPQ